MAESSFASSLDIFPLSIFLKKEKKYPDSKQMEQSRITHTGELY